jgi:hypothetical protein
MSKNIGNEKLAEAKKVLAQANKEKNAAHSAAHQFDKHSMAHKNGQAPKIVGGMEHKSSHDTVLQRQLTENAPHPRGSDTKGITIFQKQLRAGGSQTSVPKNPRRTWAQQTISGTQPLGS